MFRAFFLILILPILFSCAKKDEQIYKPEEKVNPYETYQEGIDAFENNNFFFASKKFSEAEMQFQNIDLAAKSSIMSSFSLYGINFYDEAIENLERFLKTYPSDKNIIYAHYLIAVIYFEQISDEKKDLKPLLLAKDKIDFFLTKYSNSEYAIDLNFKKDLIINQLAAKELFIAKYYISVKKWVPAINRLKNIVSNFDKTIFIEEALHRLVEIHYHIGLEEEAKKYAKILGYNYNSSEWFSASYKIFNKNYEKEILKKNNKLKKDKSFLKKIIGLFK
jgi:outer membrane protein assembly factor BamD